MDITISNYSNSVLLLRFREFYFAIIRFKRLISQPPTREAAQTESNGADKTDPLVLEVWQRLLSLLETQALRVGDQSGFTLEVYREAQYVMAALADEIFLHLDWTGRDFWTSHLLESRLFDSHVAGEMVFRKLDQLLRDRDPVYRDLAAVYFLALSLGFKGKYEGESNREQLDFYRRETFAFIFRDDPRMLEESRYLFPKAYTRTLEEQPKARFKDTRLWLTALAVVTSVWLVSSHLQWKDLSDILKSDVQEVMTLMGQD